MEEHLIFDEDFQEPLDDLPNGVKILEIYSSYEQNLDFLPESLEELYLYKYLGKLNNLPSNLKILGICEENENEIIVPENCEIRYYWYYRKRGGCWVYWK